MAGLVLFILIFAVVVLAAVCVRRQTKILSLKREIAFMELTLRQLSEKEKASHQDIEGDAPPKGAPGELEVE